MTFQIVLIIHVLLALALIALILMQHGKGADAGAAFGSGSSGTVFGARGANSLIYKWTAGSATAFFITSLIWAYLATNDPSVGGDTASVMQSVESSSTVIPEVPSVSTESNSSNIPD